MLSLVSILFRSHPAILKVPNDLFYDGELQVCADEYLRNSYCSWEYLPKKVMILLSTHTERGKSRHLIAWVRYLTTGCIFLESSPSLLETHWLCQEGGNPSPIKTDINISLFKINAPLPLFRKGGWSGEILSSFYQRTRVTCPQVVF